MTTGCIRICALAFLLLCGCATGTSVNPRTGDGGATHTGPRDGGPRDGGAEADSGPMIADRDGDGVPDEVDCAPDDAGIGRMSEEPCSSACATGVQPCRDGVVGACTAPTDCTCTFGAVREIDCVRCGTQRQRCEEGEWVDDGDCISSAVCTPGERQMEADEGCGLGGQRARECSAACVFGDWMCVSGTPVGIWALPTGATRWLRYPLDPSGSPFAPTEPVEAAFEVEERGEAFILTRNRYHVLRVSDRQWLRSGRRVDLFPEAGTEELLGAYGTPTRLTGELLPDATLLTRNRSFVYPRFNAMTGSSEPPLVAPCCEEQWPGALAPPAANVRGMWVDPENAEHWPRSSHPTCTEPPPEFYFGVLATPGRVHIQDPHCAFDFVDSVPFASFPPFALPDAPPFEDVRATFFLSGLFVVGGP